LDEIKGSEMNVWAADIELRQRMMNVDERLSDVGS
jgi:hypothetical protein